MTTEPLFYTPSGLQLSLDQVTKGIISFIEGDPHKDYVLTIGSDSELYDQAGSKEKGKADFVTAIVIHRVGRGATYYWRRIPHQKVATLRGRMYQEVLYSLEVARQLFEFLKFQEIPNVAFEIHIDVGENGATKTMLAELIGMIRANNFVPRTKPESYAASSVADRHV